MQDCFCHSPYQFFLTDTMGTALLFIKGSRTYIIVVDFIRAFQHHAFFTVPHFTRPEKKRQPLCPLMVSIFIRLPTTSYWCLLITGSKAFSYRIHSASFVDHNLYFMVGRCIFLYQHSGVKCSLRRIRRTIVGIQTCFRQTEPCL